MKTKKHIDEIRKDDEFIDNYLNEFPDTLIPEFYNLWEKNAPKISKFIDNNIIDGFYLIAIADILIKKRKENLALLKHSNSTSKDYIGASDLSEFIKKYKNGDAVPIRIVIDYKTRFEKGDKNKPRKKEEFKTMDAKTVTIEGRKILKLLFDPYLKDNLQELAHVFGTYERQPLFEPKTFPNTKQEFIAKHNKAAVAKIFSFFNLYPELKEKQKKIHTMKVLVFMDFLDSHDKYKKVAKEKKLKKVLAENEYYLQRYTDLTKVR